LRRVRDHGLDLEAESAEPGLDERLSRLLLAEEARHPDELGEEAHGLAEATLHRAAGVR